MKRILPRFSRFLLIGALVAVVAGSLAPAGKAIGDSIVCPRSTGSGGEPGAPSALPVSTEVNRGASVKVALNNFAEGSALTATIAGRHADFKVNPTSTCGTLTVKENECTGTKLVRITGYGLAGEVRTVSFLLTVVSATLTVSPTVGLTGSIVTITGTGFPARTALSEINFGRENALPVLPATDVYGNFTITMTVPPYCPGDSCVGHGPPVLVCVSVADVVGCTDFTIPMPFISLSTDKARPGDTITITGVDFSTLANVDTINFGQAPALPAPKPLTDAGGDFSAAVVVPALNPGAYTVTVRTGPNFTATAPIRILTFHGDGVTPEVVFEALTSRSLLTLAAATPAGGTDFGAYVPDLPGDTLVIVEPNGVLVLTLAKDARISVSGQPAVDVAADTPTLFALGWDVSVKVVEHDP